MSHGTDEAIGANQSQRRGLRLLVLFVGWAALVGRTMQLPLAMPDALRFIAQAQLLGVDPLRAVRTETYHPLFSLIVLWVHGAMGAVAGAPVGEEATRMAWIHAAQAAGIFFAGLMPLLVFALSRRLGARFWPALAAGAAWIVGKRISLYGAAGMSDMLELCLFSGALILAIDALRERRSARWWRFALAGVLSGLAYLTRPEGLAAPLMVALAVAIGWAACKLLPAGRNRKPTLGRRFKLLPRRGPSGSTFAGVCVMLASTAIVAAPYMIAIGGITQKKPLLATAAGASAAPEEGAGDADAGSAGARPAVVWVWEEICRTFGYVPMAVLLLPMLWHRRLWGRPRLRLVVLVWAGVWLAVMFWLLYTAHYLSGRHTLCLQVLLFAMLGLALPLWRRVMRPRVRWGGVGGWAAMVEACVFILILAASAFQWRQPPWPEAIPMAQAAAWVRNNIRDDVLVCDRSQLVGYYALHPFARCGDAQTGAPRPGEIAQLRAERRDAAGHEPVALVGRLFLPGQPITQTADGYAAIATFHVAAAEAGYPCVYVLYASPGTVIYKDGRASHFIEPE